MKTYVMTSGIIFVLLALARLWRMVVESRLATDPAYIGITIAAAAMAAWAWRVLRAAPKP